MIPGLYNHCPVFGGLKGHFQDEYLTNNVFVIKFQWIEVPCRNLLSSNPSPLQSRPVPLTKISENVQALFHPDKDYETQPL